MLCPHTHTNIPAQSVGSAAHIQIMCCTLPCTNAHIHGHTTHAKEPLFPLPGRIRGSGAMGSDEGAAQGDAPGAHVPLGGVHLILWGLLVPLSITLSFLPCCSSFRCGLEFCFSLCFWSTRQRSLMARVPHVAHRIAHILQHHFGRWVCNEWLWATVISSDKPQFASRATSHNFSHSDPWDLSLIHPKAPWAQWGPQCAASQRVILAKTHLFQSLCHSLWDKGGDLHIGSAPRVPTWGRFAAGPPQQDAARCNPNAATTMGHTGLRAAVTTS